MGDGSIVQYMVKSSNKDENNSFYDYKVSSKQNVEFSVQMQYYIFM